MIWKNQRTYWEDSKRWNQRLSFYTDNHEKMADHQKCYKGPEIKIVRSPETCQFLVYMG